MMKSGIAIVGMACRYPDASSPDELWMNVLAGRRAFRRIPPERLRVEDYFAADAQAEDSIYSSEGAFIEGYEFDRVRFRIAGSTFRSASRRTGGNGTLVFVTRPAPVSRRSS